MVLRSIPLWSEELGLAGRSDAVEVEDDGSVRPVEYKSGVRHGECADLQVCAQAICLEEMLGLEVPFGFVWYGGPRRRSRVEFTSALRQRVVEVVESIRAQLVSGRLPAAPNDERCDQCQLRHYCLPELTAAPLKVPRYMNNVVYRCDT